MSTAVPRTVPGLPMQKLRLEQGPPLSVPAVFFLLAPLAIIASGVLLLSDGAALLASRWIPGTMALAHLGTLGFVGAVMLGAIYQVVPVLGGAPVPWIRLAHAVQLGLLLGLSALTWGFLRGTPIAFVVAAALLAATLAAFLIPVAVALVRAPVRNETTMGLRLAVAGLALLVLLGPSLAMARAGQPWLPDLTVWLYAHVGVGFAAWVGGLIAAVSWQVLPMFYLAPAVAPLWHRTVLVLLSLSIVAWPILLFTTWLAGTGAPWALLAALPAALAVWLVHPISSADTLRRSSRRRTDTSPWFWWLGLSVAPLALLLAVATAWLDDARWPLLFGWVVVWGWAGSIVHGMLGRIVPFLVWLHRCSPLIGRVNVPPMRRLLPDKHLRTAFWLHLATLLLGIAAIASGAPILARILGLALIATGLVLLVNLGRVLAFKPAAPTPG